MIQSSNLLTTLIELWRNYINQATPFFIIHIALLIYFLFRWLKSYNFLQKDLKIFKDKKQTPELLKGVEEQIKNSYEDRVLLLKDLEGSIYEKLYRNTEPLRLYVNSFIIVGLMGTLFSLFEMGSHVDANNPKLILNRMSIAFSASFFGLLLSLFCNLFLLKSLRVRVTKVGLKVREQLEEFNKLHPTKTPAKALEDAASQLKASVNDFYSIVEKIEETQASFLETSIEILQEFSKTSSGVMSDLSEKVSTAQKEMTQSAHNLQTNVSTSLEDLKKSFIEISENWKTELTQTIQSSENAATLLSKSSDNLAQTTKEVTVSLNSVTQALQKTKQLARIVENVEYLTDNYLKQTEGQMQMFHSGLGETVESAKKIPDEWFTQLNLRNTELEKALRSITNNWKEELIQIGNDFFTEFDKINGTLDTVNNFLGPSGELQTAVTEIRDVTAESKQSLAIQDQTTANLQAEDFTQIKNELAVIDEKISNLVLTKPQNKDGIVDPKTLEQIDSKISQTLDLISEMKKSNDKINSDDTKKNGVISENKINVGNDTICEIPSDLAPQMISPETGEIETTSTKRDDILNLLPYLRGEIEETPSSPDNTLIKKNRISKWFNSTWIGKKLSKKK